MHGRMLVNLREFPAKPLPLMFAGPSGVSHDFCSAVKEFLMPGHPCSLESAVGELSASQQLPLVQLLARLLEGPEQQQQQQQLEEGQAGSLSFRGTAAEALASKCLSKGRKELSRQEPHILFEAAMRQLEAAAAGAASGDLQPGPAGFAPPTVLRWSALLLVAAVLMDETEVLRELSRSGARTRAASVDCAERGAFIVEAMAAALHHLHSMLATAAAMSSCGATLEAQHSVEAVNDVIMMWCHLSAALDEPSCVLLLPDAASQATAARAADALLRLAPLLPRLLAVRHSPDGVLEFAAAGSPGMLVAQWESPGELLANNTPQCLAVNSAGLASWLLKAQTLGGPANAAAAMTSGGSSHSGGGKEELAAAAWLTAMAAFKFQWALASQTGVAAAGRTRLEVFPIDTGGFAAATGCTRLAHQSCDIALKALLSVLASTTDPEQQLDAQR